MYVCIVSAGGKLGPKRTITIFTTRYLSCRDVLEVFLHQAGRLDDNLLTQVPIASGQGITLIGAGQCSPAVFCFYLLLLVKGRLFIRKGSNANTIPNWKTIVAFIMRDKHEQVVRPTQRETHTTHPRNVKSG
jgi:hypothetical protein